MNPQFKERLDNFKSRLDRWIDKPRMDKLEFLLVHPDDYAMFYIHVVDDNFKYRGYKIQSMTTRK